MPKGVPTVGTTVMSKDSAISAREQEDLHRGLLETMTEAGRGEIRFNPNLDGGPDGWLRERVYVACHAPWCKGMIATHSAECELAKVASGTSLASASGYF